MNKIEFITTVLKRDTSRQLEPQPRHLYVTAVDLFDCADSQDHYESSSTSYDTNIDITVPRTLGGGRIEQDGACEGRLEFFRLFG